MSDTVISVKNLGKRYVLGSGGRSNERYTALRDVIANKARSIFRNPQSAIRNLSEAVASDFWALKDVSFEIKQGEVVGIVGRNGAGKSTLLKILSRITDPTEGSIKIRGRVASLLEVGTGFHPELSGRENIYLNGAILGMSRAEIKVRFDEIVAFAEVEKFLDTPVKRYSSGMYVRLAFAVAAHLEPEILVVDEVLAVGDAQFQKKCLGKMHEVSSGGRTVLFVSHNIAAISNLCSECLYLNQGKMISFGPTDSVLKNYLSNQQDISAIDDINTYRTVKIGDVRLTSLSVSGSEELDVYAGQSLNLHVEIESLSKIEEVFFGVTILDHRGDPVGACVFPERYGFEAGEIARFILRIGTENLAPSIYSFSVGLGRGGHQEILDAIVGYPKFEVRPLLSGSATEVWSSAWGSIIFKNLGCERSFSR